MEPVLNLTALQALVYINRWAKLKQHYNDDVDILYRLKDDLIREWFIKGEMIATGVIRRESAIAGAMKEQIANGGEDLYFFDNHRRDNELALTDEESRHYYVLKEFADASVQVSLREDEIKEAWAEYHEKLAHYVAKENEYKEKQKQHKDEINNYNTLLKKWRNQTGPEALKWSEQNNIGISANKITELKIILLIQKGFTPETPRPIPPNGAPISDIPKKPEPPITTRWIKPEYIPGSEPELEAAIAWAKSILEKDVDYADLDDSFICDLEDALREEELQSSKEFVVDIFKQILNHELTDPQEIYDSLTAYRMDYSQSIGMRHNSDRHGNDEYWDFNKWHEINLSPTGMWLVEFQSTIDESVIFHIPYDRCLKLIPGLEIKSLAMADSDQLSYGRAITPEEQQIYPIESLLAIFNYTKENFPYGLTLYVKSNKKYYFQEWDYPDDDDEYYGEHDY